jgi:hypothetical protein
MRLNKAQKEALLGWIAEGLKTDEINKRAAKFKPRFKVSTRLVTHYRKSRDVKLDEIQEAGEISALKKGFAVKEKRVEALQMLADVLLGELTRKEDNRLWLTQVKGIGSYENYERIEYQEFNKAEVDSFRGLLDDIATEVGQRVKRTDLTSGDKPLPRNVDPKLLKTLTDEQLAILDQAANILETAGGDQGPSQQD